MEHRLTLALVALLLWPSYVQASCLTPTAQRIARAVGGVVVSGCRNTLIAGTRRRSAHASGQAVDIVPKVRRGAEQRGRRAGATCVIHYSWSPHIHFDHRDRC